MADVEFVTPLHTATKRDYIGRVTEHDKAECADIAKQWGQDYWDGARQHGYGGYSYDGRWMKVAKPMVEHYGLKPGDKILDVGCGKAFLLYEFTQAVPGIEVAGLDISEYGLAHAKAEVQPFLKHGHARELPFEDNSFDLVISLTTLHNLRLPDLVAAVKEIERVGRKNKYLMVESYRNEREKVNLLYWQLTCESFFTPEEWKWVYDLAGYTGDTEFIYFE
jgi:protein-L-isoaspartate(D-aspartate) O-methyltransferase